VVNRALDEAVDSAVALMERQINPSAPRPRVPFAGLVVQFFERSPTARVKPMHEEDRVAMH
jgi:hypothetical protein